MSKLQAHNNIPTITSLQEDGVDYINLIKPTTPLGKMLNPDAVFKMNTIIGDVISLRRLMEYLNREDYPSAFLTKYRLTREEIKLIKKLKTKHIKDYWVYILYFIINRVSKDVKLIKLMQNNTLPFVALGNGTVKEELFNKEINVKSHISQLAYYVSCIRIVHGLIKEEKLNDKEYITKLLNDEVNGDFFEKLVELNKVVSVA